MFDFLAVTKPDCRLEAVRSFFCHHGHKLAESVGRVGGVLAETRVIDLAMRVDNVDRVGQRIKTDLKALYRMLTLQTVCDPLFDEVQYFAAFDPASREIMQICAVTDRLAELMRELGEDVDSWMTEDSGDWEDDVPI